MVSTIRNYLLNYTTVKETWRILSPLMIVYFRRDKINAQSFISSSYKNNLKIPLYRSLLYVTYRIQQEGIPTFNSRMPELLYYLHKIINRNGGFEFLTSILEELDYIPFLIEEARLIKVINEVQPFALTNLEYLSLLCVFTSCKKDFSEFLYITIGNTLHFLYAPIVHAHTIEWARRVDFLQARQDILLGNEVRIPNAYSSIWDHVQKDYSYTSREKKYREVYYRKFTALKDIGYSLSE